MVSFLGDDVSFDGEYAESFMAGKAMPNERPCNPLYSLPYFPVYPDRTCSKNIVNRADFTILHKDME
jgi:hypothetical protein